MTNIIQHKRTTVPGRVPTAGQLLPGELAINTADGKIFAKKADGTVIDVSVQQVLDGGEIIYNSLTNDLMAFWLMDEKVGRRGDVSGNNIHLYDANCSAGSVSGLISTGTNLAHKNYLYANNAFTGHKTFSFWLKMHAAPASTVVVLRLGTDAGTDTTISVAANGDIEVNCRVGGAAVTLDAGTLALNTWTHFVLTQTTSTLAVYVDGTEADSAACTGNWFTDSDDVLYIGPRTDGGEFYIDCAGIWSRALSAAEIAQLYGEGDGFALPALPVPQIDESLFINVAAPGAVTAMSIAVTGSSGTLVPAFNADIFDYCVLTGTAVNNAAVTYTLTINGQSIPGSGNVGKLIRVVDDTNNYYIRLLPSDLPLPTITTAPTEDYIPGYYMTTGRRDLSTPPNYNMIYDQNGVPVWYQVGPGGTGAIVGLIHPGYDINTLLVGRRGAGGARYALTLTSNAITAQSYNLLPTTKNGNPYQFDWQQHEFFQISGPPSRRGNIITCSFIPTPATNTPQGQQAIADKAFGIYIQEQSPTGALVWDWWSGDYFNTSTATYAASFFHANALDVNPITGDVVVSFRGCSAIVCVDYVTKNVKWVLQGPPQAVGPLSSVADPVTTSTTQFLQLENEPILNGYQHIGPAGQHHIKFRTNVVPLTPGNDIITMFDNQTNFFPGNSTVRTVASLSGNGTLVTGTTTADHGWATGNYVQVAGSSISGYNGIFQITVVDTTTFTYSAAATGTPTGTITAVRATNYFPGAGPQARGVIYEIDLVQNKAIHRASIFGNGGPSSYLGSYTILEHPDGQYTHTIDFNTHHPVLVEYSDEGDGVSPGAATFAFDLPGDYYRILKAPKEYFDINYLRATTNLPVT